MLSFFTKVHLSIELQVIENDDHAVQNNETLRIFYVVYYQNYVL